MHRSARAALAALSLALASTGAAGIIDTKEAARSWQDPGAQRVRLFFTADEGPVYLDVTLRFPGAGALRAGEVERFEVRGQIFDSGAGAPRIWVTVRPKVAYHRYSSVQGNVWAHTTFNRATASFPAGERLRVGAPPTIEGAAVDYQGAAGPITISWRDWGFDSNEGATTDYRLSVYRRSLFSGPRRVALGVLARGDEETQAVALTADHEFAQGGDEWFQPGRDYLVLVRVRRRGTSWYADDEFGDAFRGVFTYQPGAGLTLRPAEAGDADLLAQDARAARFDAAGQAGRE